METTMDTGIVTDIEGVTGVCTATGNVSRVYLTLGYHPTHRHIWFSFVRVLLCFGPRWYSALL